MNDPSDVKKLSQALVLYRNKLEKEKLERESESDSGKMDAIGDESPKKKFKN